MSDPSAEEQKPEPLQPPPPEPEPVSVRNVDPEIIEPAPPENKQEAVIASPPASPAPAPQDQAAASKKKKRSTYSEQMKNCFRRKPKKQQQPADEKGNVEMQTKPSSAPPRKSTAAKPTIYDQWGSSEKEPGVRCNLYCKKQDGELMVTPVEPGIDSVWHVFQNGLKISPTGKCLGWREGNVYKFHSYEEVARRVRQLASSLATYGLNRQDRVGIYSQARPEWLITALALTSRSLAIVPLYDTLGIDSCNYIINQVEMGLLFTDTPAAAKKIVANASSTPTLNTVVIFTEPDADLVSLAKDQNIRLFTLEKFITSTEEKKDDQPPAKEIEGTENKAFDDCKEQGEGEQDGKAAKVVEEEQVPSPAPASPVPKVEDEKNNKEVYDLPTLDDIFVIMYTSGTTGEPKGVVHLHRSIVANVVGIDAIVHMNDFGVGHRFTKDDVALHYLPLAHSYGLLCVLWFFYCGSACGFYSGNVVKLGEDAQMLKPTFMTLVPRLMNRVYTRVMTEVGKSKMKSAIFSKAYAAKKADLVRGIITRNSFWDKLVFRKIQAQLGGRIWFMSVGSAPVSHEVLEWWRVVFGALIIEGYGQTECAAAATAAISAVGGHVGHPLPCNYIKLADAPESGYFVSEGRGEICLKGGNIMAYYYKQPEKTAEAIDADGWLHTGDVGQFLPDGSVKIVDRKKNIFKLAQGEYIAPEKIENVYLLCPAVSQVFVDGNSLESYTVAVVVPDPAKAELFAKEKNVDVSELQTNPEFIKLILEALLATGKENNLNSLEQVKSICLSNQPFTVDNGLITPTLKNKRLELRRFFQDQIAALYAAGPMVGAVVETGPSASSSKENKTTAGANAST